MKELKRLSTGLLSALMVLTLILAPIPQTGRAWAEDQKDCVDDEDLTSASGGVYKAGCKFKDGALKDVTLEGSHQYHESKIKSIVEQYIVGLFGLIMINGMRWNYLHKVRPETYGMDCPTNFGAKLSIPIAQLAALAYIIGDAQANVKFKQAAKDAVDAAFAEKGKSYIPADDSEEVQKWLEEGKAKGEVDPRIKALQENNTQVEAYDKLLAILKSQEGATKTKRNLARVASIGYYAAEGVELSNIISCTATCTASKTLEKADLVKAKALYATATTTVATEQGVTCAPPVAVGMVDKCAACTLLLTQLQAFEAKFAASVALTESKAAGVTAKKTLKNIKVGAFIAKFFSKLVAWFRPGANVATEQLTNEITEAAGGAVSQTVEEAEAITRMAKTVAEATGKASGDAAAMIAMNTTAEICTPAGKSVQSFIAEYGKWAFQKTMCCGGDGITLGTQQALEKSLGGANTTNAFWQTSMATRKGKDLAMCKVDPTNGLAGCGTYVYQGVPTKSVFHKTNDILVFGLFDKVSAFENPEKMDQFQIQKEFSKIMLRSGLESLLLSTNSKKLLKDPRKYIRQVKINSEKIEELLNYYDQEVMNDIEGLISTEKLAYTNKMKKFVNKVINELFIPSAEANLGMAAGGMLLSMVGNQVENPWLKEIFNMGSKLMMFQGIIGGFVKEYALVSPMGRSITWAVIATANEFVISFLKQTDDQIKENIKVVEAERQRFMDSAAANTTLATNNSNGGSQLNLQKYDPTAARNNAMNIKACAVPKGDGFAPAMCPAVIPKQKFTLPDVSGRTSNHLTPDFLKGMSLLSDMSYAAASGNLSGDSMSDSQLAQIDSLNKAMAAHNSKLRDQVDAHNASIKTKDGLSSPALQTILNNFKRDLGSGGGGSSDLGLGGSPVASASPRLNPRADDGEKVIEGTGSKQEGQAVTGAPVATTPGLDLDFGDEATGVTNTDEATEGAVSAKGEEKLEDFVLNHDDIDKRSEVPIWKILSNRYILSYPKILEEEKAEPTQQ